MNKLSIVLLSLIISALTGWFVAAHYATDKEAARPPTAFERVTASGTLRCAYIVIPPRFVKDPQTGGFSGIAYDIVEEMAKSLNLKVDWAEEVNFGTLAEGLKTGRYDAVCFPL